MGFISYVKKRPGGGSLQSIPSVHSDHPRRRIDRQGFQNPRRQVRQGQSKGEVQEVLTSESESGDSEAEDPQSFCIRDSLSPGQLGVDSAMVQRGRSAFEDWLPHGRELIHLVPSEGAKPPDRSLLISQNDTPPSPIRPKIIPVVQSLSDLHLPDGLNSEQRWNFMNHPDKPDFTATKIATQGLTLEWIQVRGREKPPPLITWKVGSKLFLKNIPNYLKTAESQFPLLEPFLVTWEEHDIATCDIHEIPDQVFVSRLFTVPKDKIEVRPVIDLSEMNKSVKTPRTKMEHLEDTTRLLQEPSWAAKLDIKDAFWSVIIVMCFRRYFCFWIKGKMWMFKRMPF